MAKNTARGREQIATMWFEPIEPYSEESTQSQEVPTNRIRVAEVDRRCRARSFPISVGNDRRADLDDARIESVSSDDPASDDGLRWQNRETVIARKAPDLIRNWTDQG